MNKVLALLVLLGSCAPATGDLEGFIQGGWKGVTNTQAWSEIGFKNGKIGIDLRNLPNINGSYRLEANNLVVSDATAQLNAQAVAQSVPTSELKKIDDNTLEITVVGERMRFTRDQTK